MTGNALAIFQGFAGFPIAVGTLPKTVNDRLKYRPVKNSVVKLTTIQIWRRSHFQPLVSIRTNKNNENTSYL